MKAKHYLFGVTERKLLCLKNAYFSNKLQFDFCWTILLATFVCQTSKHQALYIIAYEKNIIRTCHAILCWSLATPAARSSFEKMPVFQTKFNFVKALKIFAADRFRRTYSICVRNDCAFHCFGKTLIEWWYCWALKNILIQPPKL